MSQFGRFAAAQSFLLAVVLLAPCQCHPQSAPPAFIHDEIQRAESDFASGGTRALDANWNACVDRVRASHDANAAERCIAYGYSALLLSDASAYGGRANPMSDALNVGQLEMLDIMGLPAGPRQ